MAILFIRCTGCLLLRCEDCLKFTIALMHTYITKNNFHIEFLDDKCSWYKGKASLTQMTIIYLIKQNILAVSPYLIFYVYLLLSLFNGHISPPVVFLSVNEILLVIGYSTVVIYLVVFFFFIFHVCTCFVGLFRITPSRSFECVHNESMFSCNII